MIRTGRLLAAAVAAAAVIPVAIALAVESEPRNGDTAPESRSQTRFFQDRIIGTGVRAGGELELEIVFKDKAGNRRFTPRRLEGVYFEVVPVTCNPGGQRVVAGFHGRDVSANIQKGRFSSGFQGFGGTITGKVYRRGTRVAGAFNIRDMDFNAELMSCATDGPQRYDATRCRRSNQDLKVPVCRVGGGS